MAKAPAANPMATNEDASFAPLSERDIAEQTDSSSFSRGQSYFRKGNIFDPIRRGAVIRAQCHGSSGGPYGTLDGHPESGEEYFGVRLNPDGTVYAEIVAFSRPARWWSKAGSWVATRVQKRITDHYLAALSTTP